MALSALTKSGGKSSRLVARRVCFFALMSAVSISGGGEMNSVQLLISVAVFDLADSISIEADARQGRQARAHREFVGAEFHGVRLQSKLPAANSFDRSLSW